MPKLQVVVPVAALILVAILVGAQQRSAPAPAEQGVTSEMRAILTSAEVMTEFTVPSSDVVFKIAGDQPRNDEDWTRVRQQARVLAESANLLMVPGRGPDAATWNQMSAAMLTAALSAATAAEAKNLDALDTASNEIYDTCDTCHKKYMDK